MSLSTRIIRIHLHALENRNFGLENHDFDESRNNTSKREN